MADLNNAGFTINPFMADTGSAAFKFKGYVISMSTVFKRPDVVIFGERTDEVLYHAHTVEDAITWCENNP